MRLSSPLPKGFCPSGIKIEPSHSIASYTYDTSLASLSSFSVSSFFIAFLRTIESMKAFLAFLTRIKKISRHTVMKIRTMKLIKKTKPTKTIMTMPIFHCTSGSTPLPGIRGIMKYCMHIKQSSLNNSRRLWIISSCGITNIMYQK